MSIVFESGFIPRLPPRARQNPINCQPAVFNQVVDFPGKHHRALPSACSGVFVAEPDVDDDPALHVVSEIQAVLLEDLVAEPVSVPFAKCGIAPVFRAYWVVGNDFKDKFDEGGELFGSVLVDVGGRAIFSEHCHICCRYASSS